MYSKNNKGPNIDRWGTVEFPVYGPCFQKGSSSIVNEVVRGNFTSIKRIIKIKKEKE